MLSNEELLTVCGGAAFSTLLNSITKAVDSLFELGRSVGSTLRRAITKTFCKVS